MSRFIVSPHAQGTDGWRMDRLGKVTGSECAAVFATVKSGEAATRANLRMSKVLERITGVPTPQGFHETEDIAWGNAQEPHSRMAYELARDLVIEEQGFAYLPDVMAGCSVDGVIRDGARTGFWESKSPKSKNHYAYLRGGVVPAEYMPQVVHTFWITGYDFCDFQSFDPRMPPKLRTFITRVERAELADRIEAHERGVLQFLMEVDAEEKQLRQRAA
jgi:hypothetical protein